MWTNWAGPAVAAGTDDVLVAMVEAGWPPWIATQNVVVSVNTVYRCGFGNRFDAARARASPLCQAILAQRRRQAWWIPWVKTLPEMNSHFAQPEPVRQNARCSFGAILFPQPAAQVSLKLIDTYRVMLPGHRRPVMRIRLGENADDITWTLLLVHLTARQYLARRELRELVRVMRQLVPTGRAVVVGDMNVNLMQHQDLGMDEHWSVMSLNPVAGTQASGGCLDWGLLYNPLDLMHEVEVTVLDPFHTPPRNLSDHSVMRYEIADVDG